MNCDNQFKIMNEMIMRKPVWFLKYTTKRDKRVRLDVTDAQYLLNEWVETVDTRAFAPAVQTSNPLLLL